MSKGWIPTPIRNVKPFVAVVQERDSVSRIAHRMTGRADRWPELVGANLHKPLSPGNVAGSPYRVFESLDVGEQLSVPASWPNPAPGAVGAVIVATPFNKGKILNPQQAPAQSGGLDPIQPAITAILTALSVPGTLPTGLSFPPIPSTFGIPDVSKVIRSWWPYLQQLPPGSLPGLPAISGVGGYDSWLQLVTSATTFLTALGVTPSQLDTIAKIPWDSLPFDNIPWQQLIVGTTPETPGGPPLTDVWNMIIAATNTPPTGTGPVQSGSLTGTTPNFYDPNTWTKAPFNKVKGSDLAAIPQNIPTNSLINMDDTELLGCIQANPGRAAELAKYATCFAGQIAKLKQYMCNPQLDASKCATAIPDPTKVLPPGVNWNCTPTPQCWADQLKGLPTTVVPPAGVCPPPGTSYPECIPEWYKTITGTNPPAPAPAATNYPLYVGLAVAGVALVGGVILLAMPKN